MYMLRTFLGYLHMHDILIRFLRPLLRKLLGLDIKTEKQLQQSKENVWFLYLK